MNFDFLLQTSRPGATTLQAIASAADGSESGRGLFAWATVSGVRKLLDLPEIRLLLDNGHLDLVIGTDAVTNEAAVKYLRDAEKAEANLQVKFFVHNERRFYHPKIAWFNLPNGDVRMVSGSGNLTAWGLEKNWEAAVALELDPSHSNSIDASFMSWSAQNSAYILNSSDMRALERAQINKPVDRAAAAQIQPSSLPPNTPQQSTSTATEIWLLSELNRSRKNSVGQSLFSQSSFSHQVAVDYFGYSSAGRTLYLHEVESDGTLSPQEERQVRFKKSINYYFEMGARRGVPYPAAGAPIAAFRRISSNRLLYTISLPGDHGYTDAKALLYGKPNLEGTSSRKMRRAYFSDSEIATAWPDSLIMNLDQP